MGGYHGAKLARYQDLIERYLTSMDEGVLDMLNTRYLIRFDPTGQPVAELRATANGPAGSSRRSSMRTLRRKKSTHWGASTPKRRLSSTPVSSISRPLIGGEGEIRLEEYRPNYLRYEYTATAPGTAIFSEIYYKDGWTAYIDGIETPYFRADYLLRGMELRPVRTRSNGGSAPPAGTSPKRDARLVARDSRRHHCNRYTRFTP